jgi:hypothetical protein
MLSGVAVYQCGRKFVAAELAKRGCDYDLASKDYMCGLPDGSKIRLYVAVSVRPCRREMGNVEELADDAMFAFVCSAALASRCALSR